MASFVIETDKTEAAPVEENICSCRKKQRSNEEYTALINRLKRIEGQVRGIRRMVEESSYCPDILVQSSAVASALHSFNRELLSQHIRTCVLNDIKSGKEGTVEELVGTLQRLMK